MTVTQNQGGSQGQAVEKKEDLVTITIDGIEVSVPKGTLVIRAAELIGVDIPRFCDHPLLDPVGACRQCMVEIPDMGNGRGMPKPQASCTITVMPGMKVETQRTNARAEKAQKGMLEFLLINHPLDCPICDKGGECPLQNQALSHGYGESRYDGVKRIYPKPINLSAQVLLDRERCVLCARCTRFSEQIAGDPFIKMLERGALQQVGIYEKEPFESYWSGNTIQICPVGALTSADYRFRARPFDLVSVPSVAEHDSSGSAIRVDYRRGTVMRRLAGDDPEVNEEWISDKDRFAFRYGRGEDRLTTPLVRDGDELRAASWPEAIDAAVRGLKKAGSSVGVLTGGRLPVEDAYGYSKFARAVLGTNNIDFRARPYSQEEADFLAAAVAGTGLVNGQAAVTFADLEKASTVLMAGFEPEDEGGVVFLRLRKAYRKTGLKSFQLAPYLSNGCVKMGAALIPTVPGEEAATLANLPAEVALDETSVIIVGERLALAPGALTAALELSGRTGARLAWIPRRAGERGAVEAGCLPNLLPFGRPVADPSARVDVSTLWGSASLPSTPGRTAEEMLVAASNGLLEALVVGGIQPSDFRDPSIVRVGCENAGFLISLEARASEVTERADVVLPVALLEERSGSFVNWEGRERPFPVVIKKPNVMSDLRVLAALADGLGTDLGVRTAEQARAELSEFGPWEGERAAAPQVAVGGRVQTQVGTAVLSTWRLHLDDSRVLEGETEVLATARKPVARLNPRTATAAGVTEQVRVSTDRGAVTFDVEIVPGLVDGVIWLPTRAPGLALSEHLAVSSGEVVRIEGAHS
ncbi:NADH-quinone oxidoreductase subunit G [Microlunatus sp. Gsoil 973]|uniref:NADH-quinone oxidoreductase subunit G n=1 Tax=Microlunatus sp. Gsoil 973 TaxID=2672569 RepID=UPI0012B44697|nr:NADH-quinone oxidoreductase subunit G [Microlunatus sp. Gsoil 973]QGN34853.1 NADH-quinone oxidoreductase subunit G [Microlunatus sp. Gsoil 973]